MRRVDLDRLRARALSHVPLAIGGNGVVGGGHHRPRGQRLPGRGLGAILEDRGERPLADREDLDEVIRQIGRERLLVELGSDRQLDRGLAVVERVVVRANRTDEGCLAEPAEISPNDSPSSRTNAAT